MSNPSESTKNVSDANTDEVCRVAVKVPPFWPKEPALWFVQLEGQFVLANITADVTKFYHVLSNLDYKYVCEVKDIVTNPPSENKYEKIKSELILRLSASQEQKVRQLLTHEELGDRKPSQFLRHLRSLAGSEVTEEFIRSLWTNRLPSHIQAIIAAQADLPLDSLAQIVDKIHEITLPTSAQVASVSSESAGGTSSSSAGAIEQLTRRIEELSRKVAELSTDTRSRNPNRSCSPHGRRRSRSRSEAGPRHCWYHRRFGSNSTKCRSPCSYRPGNEKSSQ